MQSRNMDQQPFALRDRCLGGSLPLKKRRVSLGNFTESTTSFSQTYNEGSLVEMEPLKKTDDFDSQVSINYENGISESNHVSMKGSSSISSSATALKCMNSNQTDHFQNSDDHKDFGRPYFSSSHEIDLSRSSHSIHCKSKSINSRLQSGPRTNARDDEYESQSDTLTFKCSVGDDDDWNDDYEETYEGLHEFKVPLGESITVSSNCAMLKKRNRQMASSSHSHQDRRFTGCDGEVQCSATTTRGRACAYTCVGGTKYCNLHADYDTNPPPRRCSIKVKNVYGHKRNDGTSFCTDTVPSLVVGNSSKSSLRDLEKLPEAQLITNSSTPSVVSDELPRLPSPFVSSGTEKFQFTKRPKRLSSSKVAAKHAGAPFPLLSMISTDQWYQKSVRIACGNLAGKVGKVEKWGNGWVSVDIPGIGLHNRRSFELFLNVCDAHPGCDMQDLLSINHDESLLRCVSRDVVTPLSSTVQVNSQYTDCMSSSDNLVDAPQKFQNHPPSDAEKPFPIFGGVRREGTISRAELSPLTMRDDSCVNDIPKVTPLSSRESYCFTGSVFTEQLRIPASVSHDLVTTKNHQ